MSGVACLPSLLFVCVSVEFSERVAVLLNKNETIIKFFPLDFLLLLHFSDEMNNNGFFFFF